MSPWILVIDDDPWTREALVAILRRAGYQVTTLERFEPELAAGNFSQRYQVAVLDYHLPHLNGLEVARRLRQFQPDCRIVMISSELPGLLEAAGREAVVVLRSMSFVATPPSVSMPSESGMTSSNRISFTSPCRIPP